MSKFREDFDSGFESFDAKNEESNKISSKAILYCLENGDLKNILEECIEKLLMFLQSQQIYKFHTDSIQKCRDIIFRLIKYVEENDELENIISICQTFLCSLWDTYEHEQDVSKV